MVMTSERGKPLIVINNNKFYKYRILKTTSETCWCCVKKSCRAKLYTFGDDPNVVFSKTTGMHEHESVSENNLNRQKVNNQVKRKATDWICERPSKIIYRELNNHNETLEKLTSKDVMYIRNNFGREKRKQILRLPSSDVHDCLNLMELLTSKGTMHNFGKKTYMVNNKKAFISARFMCIQG